MDCSRADRSLWSRAEQEWRYWCSPVASAVDTTQIKEPFLVLPKTIERFIGTGQELLLHTEAWRPVDLDRRYRAPPVSTFREIRVRLATGTEALPCCDPPEPGSILF